MAMNQMRVNEVESKACAVLLAARFPPVQPFVFKFSMASPLCSSAIGTGAGFEPCFEIGAAIANQMADFDERNLVTACAAPD